MIAVTLSFRTGATRMILLSGIPRVGDHIRPKETIPESESLRVEQVLWLEAINGDKEPSVVVSVVPRKLGR
jgi:hypothetical protein